jgi:hypothetical protein
MVGIKGGLSMQNFKISMKDGRVFYNKGILLGSSIMMEAIDKVATEFPVLIDIVRCNGTKEGVELSLGKLVIDSEFSPYLGKEFIKSYEDFGENKKLIFDKNTKTITETGEIDLEFLLSEENLRNFEWMEPVLEFMMYVVMHRNPYVYNLFTEYTPKSKKFANSIWLRQTIQLIKNVYNHIDKLDNIEKIAKTIGEDFIFDNIIGEFELNNAGKKLHQVVEIPLVVANGIKKLKIEETYNDFKTIANVDKSHSVLLIEWLLAFKKVFNSSFCGKHEIIDFVANVAKLMETGIYDDSFSILLNYLINENFSYSNFSIPNSEARELYDFIVKGLNMQAVDENVQFERFPKNIQKAHNVMSKNESIISIPRPEEFAEAVKKYAFVNDETDDNFIFKAPENELELLNEGNMLHHCVASYRDRIIDFGCKVVLMRRKDDADTPLVTIEYEDGNVLQIKEKFNEDVTDPVLLDAVDRWAVRARRREKKMR